MKGYMVFFNYIVLNGFYFIPKKKLRSSTKLDLFSNVNTNSPNSASNLTTCLNLSLGIISVVATEFAQQ